MINGVTIRNLSFTRVENTNSVTVTFQVMIQENGAWRDVTMIGNLWFKYYSSRVDNPRNGVGEDWEVQDVRHYTESNIGDVRTGTPTSQGGSGYWYTYTWTSTPDENHAHVLKAQCTVACKFPGDDPNWWPNATAMSERIPNPAAEDAEAAKHAAPPEPTSPSAELQNNGSEIWVTATVPNGSAVYQEVYRQVDGGPGAFISGVEPLYSESQVKFVDWDVSPGHSYRYRITVMNIDGVPADSDFTDYVETVPLGITDLKATTVAVSSGTGSVKLGWALLGNVGEHVEIQWCSNTDFSPATGSAELDYPATVYNVEGLDAAKRWYFRVWSENDAGASVYQQVDTLLATTPTVEVAPLLKSYKSSDSVTVTWQHASEDGSVQDQYEVRVTSGGSSTTLSGTTDTSKTISLSSYSDGTVVGIEVRTHSVGGWSDWSAPVQEFTVYAPPSATLALSCGSDDSTVGPNDPLTSLPLKVTAGSSTYTTGNVPIWWHLQIAAAESYTSVAQDGTETYVADGQVLLDWSIAAGDPGFPTGQLKVNVGSSAMKFEQAKYYKAKAELMTSAGLRAESIWVEFMAQLDATVPVPNAVLSWDDNSMAVTIHPVCCYYDETQQETVYVEGVDLSVYRISEDGDAHLVAENLVNDGVSGCRDAHADLGMSTYRIVATDIATGVQAAQDRKIETPFPLSVVLWDEGQAFYDEFGEPMPYMGHALMGIYNNDANESYAKDTAYREHAGAAHPIARRGTQRGHKISLNFDVEKGSGDATLLRNLEAYDGDCYVRVPGFPGFPADARVTSIGKSHDNHCKYAATVEFTHVMDDLKRAENSSEGVVIRP